MLYEEAEPTPLRRRARRLLYVVLAFVLVVMGAQRLTGRDDRAARALTLARMRQVREALDRYAIDNSGQIPNTSQGLRALLSPPTLPPEPPNWCGPYLSQPQMIFDGWGHKFHYASPGGGSPPRPYDLWSLGKDNLQGGTGAAADVQSWEPETLRP
jgi:general secretion pathway protein G